MNSLNTNSHGICANRKCFSVTRFLIFVLLLSHASCRPSEADDVPTYNDGDYTDADDIEWQNFPIVETTTKDHPIIFYKEDIVSEDYDPNKENKSSSKEQGTEIKLLPRRKYKEISRRNRLNRTENYRYIKPEKVYFDIYPIEDDGIKEDDTKFNENDIHVEVISLVDNDNNDKNSEEDVDSKRVLSKRPKKYFRRHRQRRDVANKNAETHETAKHALRHKRFSFSYRSPYHVNQLPQFHSGFSKPEVVIYPVNRVKIPVRGIYYNPFSPNSGNRIPGKWIKSTTTSTAIPPTDQSVKNPDIINRFDGDMPIWDSHAMTTTRRPQRTSKPPRRTPPPIIHSGDEDYSPSGSNRNKNPIEVTLTTSRPPSFNFVPTLSPGRWTEQPAAIRPPQVASSQPSQQSGRVSTCIWAISACCTRSEVIRYQCFERLGCSGAFWGLNPCADDVYKSAVQVAENYFE